MTGEHPLISVVIPVYNSEKTLAACLDSLRRLSWSPVEIIMIDDGSSDASPEILKQYGDAIRVIRIPNAGPSRARNIGIREANGDFIAFTDSDCIVHPDWLDELYRGFTSPQIAGVGGDQQSPENESPFGRLVHEFMKSIGFVADYVKTATQLVKTRHNPTCNVLYQKSALIDAGGFDEGLWPGEDVDLDMKIIRHGHELRYNPAAVVYHYRPDTPVGFQRMMYRYGWAQAYLVRKYGPFRLIHYEPAILIALISFLMALALMSPLSALCLCIAGIAGTFGYFLFKTRSMEKSAAFLSLFFSLLFQWNRGFIQGIFSGRKR